MNIDVSTIEEMDAFKNNEPEKYQMLVEQVEKALNDSVIGGSFENLSEE